MLSFLHELVRCVQEGVLRNGVNATFLARSGINYYRAISFSRWMRVTQSVTGVVTEPGEIIGHRVVPQPQQGTFVGLWGP